MFYNKTQKHGVRRRKSSVQSLSLASGLHGRKTSVTFNDHVTSVETKRNSVHQFNGLTLVPGSVSRKNSVQSSGESLPTLQSRRKSLVPHFNDHEAHNAGKPSVLLPHDIPSNASRSSFINQMSSIKEARRDGGTARSGDTVKTRQSLSDDRKDDRKGRNSRSRTPSGESQRQRLTSGGSRPSSRDS